MYNIQKTIEDQTIIKLALKEFNRPNNIPDSENILL